MQNAIERERKEMTIFPPARASLPCVPIASHSFLSQSAFCFLSLSSHNSRYTNHQTKKKKIGLYETIWSAPQRTFYAKPVAVIFKPPICKVPFRTNVVRIEVDTAGDNYQNYDAVQVRSG